MNPAIHAYLNSLKASLAPPPPGPDELATREQLIEEIRAMIASLPEPEQEPELERIEQVRGALYRGLLDRCRR